MSEPCANCEQTITEDETVVLSEAADIYCTDCGEVFLDAFPEEGQRKLLSEVHPDWRSTR